MDPINTKAINNWPVPKTPPEVGSFMQFCNFYHTFIPGVHWYHSPGQQAHQERHLLRMGTPAARSLHQVEGNHQEGHRPHAPSTRSPHKLQHQSPRRPQEEHTGVGKTNNCGSLEAQTEGLVTIWPVFLIDRNIQEISRKPLVSRTTSQTKDRKETNMFLLCAQYLSRSG